MKVAIPSLAKEQKAMFPVVSRSGSFRRTYRFCVINWAWK